MVVGIVVMIIGLLVSIGLHEIGHMVPAKKFGVRVSEYFIGFGPTLWSKKKGETEYGLKAIPLGGFVRLIGMYPPANADKRRGTGRTASLVADARDFSNEEILPGEESRAFYNLSAPKKLIVMLGGPVMNLIIAIVLFTITTVGFGQLVLSTTIDQTVPCLGGTSASQESAANRDDGAGCAADQVVAPAYEAGIRAGDEITAIDGSVITQWEDVSDVIAEAGAVPLSVQVLRDGQPLEVIMTPAEISTTSETGDTQTRLQIGVSPAYQWRSDSVTQVPDRVWQSVKGTAGIVLDLPNQVYRTAQSAFAGADRGDEGVVSIVGVGRLAGEITANDLPGAPPSTSWVILLELLAGLNIALFVFNLIPLVPLDGGHVAGALYEGAKRTIAKWRGQPRPGPVDTARMVPVAYGVMFVFIAMAAVLMIADIVAPVSLFT